MLIVHKNNLKKLQRVAIDNVTGSVIGCWIFL